MSARPPLAQPLTIDFGLVTVRNAEAGRQKLGVPPAIELAATLARLEALAALVASAGVASVALASRVATLEAGSGAPVVAGAGISGSVEMDFGAIENGLASATVVEPSAPAGAVVVVSLSAAATDDHDSEDGLIECVTVAAGAVTAGVGFQVQAFAPDGTWGRYRVNWVLV